jgi:hypothetical protein
MSKFHIINLKKKKNHGHRGPGFKKKPTNPGLLSLTIIYRQPLSMGYLIPRLVISLSKKQK